MLDMRPMSGYDIQMTLEMMDAQRWAGILVGSIYHALKKLEKDLFIEIYSIEQTGNRQKAIYKITEKGQEQLKQLTYDSLKSSCVSYPTALYSALSFINKIPLEDTRKALEEQHNNLVRELEALEYGLDAKNNALKGELTPMTVITFENMFAIVKLQKEYIEKIIDTLEH